MLSELFPTLGRLWTLGHSDSELHLLFSLLPCWEHMCVGPNIGTHDLAVRKKIKNIPEDLGHMFSRDRRTRDCVYSGCLAVYGRHLKETAAAFQKTSWLALTAFIHS